MWLFFLSCLFENMSEKQILLWASRFISTCSWWVLQTCFIAIGMFRWSRKMERKGKTGAGPWDPGNNVRMSSQGFLFEDSRLGAEKVHSLGMAMAAD